MIIWLLLSLQIAQAQEPAIEEFCYSSTAKMRESSRRLKFILIPVDKVEENGKCLTVSTPPHRRDLLQNYARKVDPTLQVSFSSMETKRDPCLLKVEKVKAKNLHSLSGGINTELTPSAVSIKSDQNSTEVMSIRTLKTFELTVNEDTLKGSCTAITSDRYNIDLEVLKVAKPLYPSLPPNSIVVVSGSQIPANQETSHLSTTLQLNRGERIEIGSIIKNLKGSGSNVDSSSKGNIESSVGAATEKVFLTLD